MNKKGFGMFMLGTLGFFLLALLVLVIIFKGRLVDLINALTDFYHSWTFWVVVGLLFAIYFRRFVETVLLGLWGWVRALL